ncbi:Porin AaxA precursor [Planctomycetes bacterium CA13]|uniref:Porin AaxA n=2 Tax=Novipirellula herctigrandis TaxID=2527986 RepID=A0A5C5ZBK2_9BACT|nr:Porin AaxA precursor [Planctomycetes bacterium CA13]
MRRIACLAVILSMHCITAMDARGQNRDPEAVFERAEQLELMGVDTHWYGGCFADCLSDLKRASDNLERSGGPSLIGLYAPIWQFGTQGGNKSNMLSQSFNLYSEWELLHRPGNEGTLYTFFLHESDSLGHSAGQFANSVGTTILANDDVGDATNALGHLAWTQNFLDGNVQISVGQLALKIMLDQNDYAGWDRTSFMAQPLAGNPVRNFPIAGLGIDTTVHLTNDFQVSFLLADADGYPFYPDFKSFGRRFVYVPGFVYTPTIHGWGKGRYEVNFSHIERTERFGGSGPSSSVWLFSFQQEFSPKLATFFRFGTGDGRRTPVQQALSTGIVFTQALGYNNDRLGIGFMWQDPTDSTRRDDYGMEMFWKLQMTENIEVTPDVQLYFDPSNSPSRNTEAAFGLRVGFSF